MTPPSTARAFPRRKRRVRDPGGTGKPPRTVPRMGDRPPKCDKCHVAEAKFEVVISAAKAHYLYLCGHHLKKLAAALLEKGYQIIKL